MAKRPLGETGLEIEPLVFGGNVFGWTVDEKTSFSLLDAFVDLGFSAIDTADSYSKWVPGNKGGESETIIGNWLKANPSKRSKVHIFTKVGSDLGGTDRKGLSARWIAEEVECSLKRLGIETIDLYQSHWPDSTPYEETLGACDALIRAGKVRAIGASNIDELQLGNALKIAKEHGLPRYQVLQPLYNLCERFHFDGPLRELCVKENIGVITYYSLASGYLTGKYRSKADLGKSKRGENIEKYMTPLGDCVLDALDKVSAAHDSKPAEVALAWLIASPGVTAPIASATSLEQVKSLANAVRLKLTADDIEMLDAASSA